MTNYSDVRIFLCTTPTDMHCSFDRLLGRTREIFEQDPLEGHLFLFVNRKRDRLKLLFWDHDGYCIFYKRLAGQRHVGTWGIWGLASKSITKRLTATPIYPVLNMALSS